MISCPPMSLMGLVSRVTPVHTAVRNCTRDEGRSFEVGNQVLIFGSIAIRSMAFSRSDLLLTESATNCTPGDKDLSRSGSCRCMTFAGS